MTYNEAAANYNETAMNYNEIGTDYNKAVTNYNEIGTKHYMTATDNGESIGVLVSAGQLGWLNCKNSVADFSDFRAIYTLLYIQGKADELTALSLMPDEFQRSVMHETLRVNLMNQAKVSLKKWRRLRRYCMSAFAPDQRNLMFKEMGREYLSEALNFNWVAIQQLVIKGSTFINTHEVALLANENMPAAFKAEYNTDCMTAFLNAKTISYNAEEQAENLTAQVLLQIRLMKNCC